MTATNRTTLENSTLRKIMKLSTLALLCASLLSCGGQSPAQVAVCGGGAGVPCSQNPPPSNPYFNMSMVGQTWHFQDTAAETHDLWIEVQKVPCAFGQCSDHIAVWHYFKNDCFGYWNPRTDAQCSVSVALDELWFVLMQEPDGTWACIGFNYIDYLGTRWKVQILTPPGQPVPYTIVTTGTGYAGQQTYYNAVIQKDFPGDIANDFSPPPVVPFFSVPWITTGGSEAYISPFTGFVIATISRQREGCVAEDWDFVADVGPVRFTPIIGIGDNGACIPIEPSLIMHRVS